jgi:hypothetical protein
MKGLSDGTAWKIIQKQQHGAQRMEKGLSTMLSLHSANELSSICGNIDVKILQKASTSMKMILEYLKGMSPSIVFYLFPSPNL